MYSKFISIGLLLVSWFLEPLWLVANAQALLPSEVQTVDVTDDAVVNLTLPNGFVLSGSVRTAGGDPVALGTLTARSSIGMFAVNI